MQQCLRTVVCVPMYYPQKVTGKSRQIFFVRLLWYVLAWAVRIPCARSRGASGTTIYTPQQAKRSLSTLYGRLEGCLLGRSVGWVALTHARTSVWSRTLISCNPSNQCSRGRQHQQHQQNIICSYRADSTGEGCGRFIPCHVDPHAAA